MKKNIHPIERAFRIILGVGMVSFAILGPENHWFYFGFLPLITGLLGWCPPYQFIGYSSCVVKNKKPHVHQSHTHLG